MNLIVKRVRGKVDTQCFVNTTCRRLSALHSLPHELSITVLHQQHLPLDIDDKRYIADDQDRIRSCRRENRFEFDGWQDQLAGGCVTTYGAYSPINGSFL